MGDIICPPTPFPLRVPRHAYEANLTRYKDPGVIKFLGGRKRSCMRNFLTHLYLLYLFFLQQPSSVEKFVRFGVNSTLILRYCFRTRLHFEFTIMSFFAPCLFYEYAEAALAQQTANYTGYQLLNFSIAPQLPSHRSLSPPLFFQLIARKVSFVYSAPG